MFDYQDGVGLWPGERPEDVEVENQAAFETAYGERDDGWVTETRHSLPADLESIPPGLFLTAIVSSVDPARLNGHDAVRLMQARSRLVSHHEAQKLAAVAEVAFSPPGDAHSPVQRSVTEVEFSAEEIAAGLTLTRGASNILLNHALSLKDRLYRVWKTLDDGVIDLAKTRVFDQVLGHLPADTIDTVLDRVLADAPGLTTGQLRARVARLVLEVDPDGSASSYQEGLADRKVTTFPNPDMTANYNINSADPTAVAAARDNVEQLARHIKTISTDDRSLDEIRADISLDLLAGKCSCATPNPGGQGRVNVTVTGETLIGMSDQPGEIDGYGPVFAEIARKTVTENIDGDWTFTVTDNGKPVATGTLARRPTPAQQRHINAHYPKCVYPGCRQDAWDCDIDHRHPRQHGGDTCIHNLAPLCRHHHRTKDQGGWKLQRLQNGDHKWTSPLGHNYIRKRGPP